MITSKLGFHISAEGGRVAVNRPVKPGPAGKSKKKKTVFVWRVGYLAEDKSSVLNAAGALVGCFEPGDHLASMA